MNKMSPQEQQQQYYKLSGDENTKLNIQQISNQSNDKYSIKINRVNNLIQQQKTSTISNISRFLELICFLLILKSYECSTFLQQNQPYHNYQDIKQINDSAVGLSLISGDASGSGDTISSGGSGSVVGGFYSGFSLDIPKILTKNSYITSYEHRTIILPCEILNLPADMNVIWQYGKRGHDPQTLLYVGQTPIEKNYRIRVLINSSDVEETDYNNNDSYLSKSLLSSFLSSSSSSPTSALSNNNNNNKDDKPKQNSIITSYNLEIRKLQLSDSGWYECQLPTKPTQINYIHLQVLSYPRIEANVKHVRLGDTIELTCQIKNLPSQHELYWTFDDKRINSNNNKLIKYATTNEKHDLIKTKTNNTNSLEFQTRTKLVNGAAVDRAIFSNNKLQNSKTKRGTFLSSSALASSLPSSRNKKLRKIRNYNDDHQNLYKNNNNNNNNHTKRLERTTISSLSYSIHTEKNNHNNITFSKLKIKDIEDHHRGVYKCKYDKAEAKYNLDFKSKDYMKSFLHVYNQFYSSGSKFKLSTVIIWLNVILIISFNYI